MVRVGGITYAWRRRLPRWVKTHPGHAPGPEASSIEAGKTYKVAGWASVNEQKGAPVWDVFAKHLRAGKMSGQRGGGVMLKGVADNPGIAGQG